MTLKEIIIAHLKRIGDWEPEYKLRAIETNFGWIGSSGDVRCRELAREGQLERKIEGKYAYYRVKKSSLIEELRKIKIEDGKPIPKTNLRLI